MLFLQVFLLNTLFSNKIYFPNIAASSCAGCGTRCEFHNTPQFMHQVIHNACGQDAHIEWENTIKLLGYTRYRSHVGSDVLRFWHTENSRVSIRAPAWGATQATLNNRRGWRSFNSRSRMGSDPQVAQRIQHRRVSIRAPAWGATAPGDFGLQTGRVSIRAPAWGATPSSITIVCSPEFQFALPHGERRYMARQHALQRAVSIRAPAWGATLTGSHALPAMRFQFALPHGERLP